MVLHVLVEGTSDVPTLREILTRRIGLTGGSDFVIHPHRGKGSIPVNPNDKPSPREQQLLPLLPSKLRAYGKNSPEHAVIVVVDADRDDCHALKQALLSLYQSINPRPAKVLFRIAVEEMESWFIADTNAVIQAYPKAQIANLTAIPPDSIVDAWEQLAGALGLNPLHCSGADKEEWAKGISPHLNLDAPVSPSLKTLISGLERIAGIIA
jgi:Domain of unknown function (DUF4276)